MAAGSACSGTPGRPACLQPADRVRSRAPNPISTGLFPVVACPCHQQTGDAWNLVRASPCRARRSMLGVRVTARANPRSRRRSSSPTVGRSWTCPAGLRESHALEGSSRAQAAKTETAMPRLVLTHSWITPRTVSRRWPQVRFDAGRESTPADREQGRHRTISRYLLHSLRIRTGRESAMAPDRSHNQHPGGRHDTGAVWSRPIGCAASAWEISAFRRVVHGNRADRRSDRRVAAPAGQVLSRQLHDFDSSSRSSAMGRAISTDLAGLPEGPIG